MEKRILIDNKVVPVSETKVQFLTKKALRSPTTQTAKWGFRIVAGLTTVAFFWVEGTSLISELYKSEIMLGLKAIDMLVLIGINLSGRVEK